MFKQLASLVPTSTKDAADRISSTRIQSYYVLVLIYICVIFLCVSEGIQIYKHGSDISAQFMIGFAGLLAHHLALLRINKNSRTEPTHAEVCQGKVIQKQAGIDIDINDENVKNQ